MIIKRTVKFGESVVKYEAVIQGEIDKDFTGVVVVHDPEMKGGRLRGFFVPADGKVPVGHVIVTRIALKQ